MAIHGRPVLGGFAQFEEIAARFAVKELLVATRLSGEAIEKVYTHCRSLDISCRVIPSHFDTEHDVDMGSLRTIDIEDILFREPVSVDYTGLGKFVAGKKIMVTGAGGSIGSELVRQIAEFRPSLIVALDQSEHFLHELELSLGRLQNIDITYSCSDVTDRKKMERLFKADKPDVIFHAAAYKHVPMMERNLDAAVKNNVGGMKVMADLADRFGVGRFILISTDKAVDPVNIMGATKRVCELYLLEKAKKSGTSFMAVRFGNVLGSNGSVIPLFLSQIEKRGPLTVTHPEIERYFMTIHEAVLLILQAALFGKGGELYLLDMGQPIKIVDLAEKMIQLAGYTPYHDIDIVFSGLRPGEKLTEVLTGKGEIVERSPHKKINCVKSEADTPVVSGKIDEWLRRVNEEADQVNKEIIAQLTGAPKPSSNVIEFPVQGKEAEGR